MSKRDGERRQKDAEATAQAFEEFIKTFQNNAEPQAKIFVKSGVLHPHSKQEMNAEHNRLYQPPAMVKQQSNITLRKAIECARFVKDSKINKGKYQEKPKTNLEQLKDELRLRHLERCERTQSNPNKENSITCSLPQINTESTNLFVYNLTLSTKEQDLMQLFGTYGPLASVKIMWPRNETEMRTANCGFVAFMSRKDSERALQQLMGYEGMQIEWGKPVEIPSHPVYIPPVLLKQYLPPPYSGLPFNAQPRNGKYEKSNSNSQVQLEELLCNATVKVTIPWDKKILVTIHRMVEFVIREGPQFEAVIMNKEINNPLYSFLFDTKSSHHVYYRWKLFSILNGESTKSWTTKHFRMFKNGPVWIAPTIPDYARGMPDELVSSSATINKNLLSESQKIRLIENIRNVTLRKDTIAETMTFCLGHANACNDVVEILIDAFQNRETKPARKIGRLYLISDILYNAHVKKTPYSIYVSKLEKRLENVFHQLHLCGQQLTTISDVDMFNNRVLKILSLWELWNIYPTKLLDKWKTIFLNVSEKTPPQLVELELEATNSTPNRDTSMVQDAMLPSTELMGFIPSKWERIDPEQVEAESMSTQKIFEMEQKRLSEDQPAEETIAVQAIKKCSERKRRMLRRIEIMVVEYQDKLETGQIKLEKGQTMEMELDEYRYYLLQKLRRETKRNANSTPSDSSEEETEHRRKTKQKRTGKTEKKVKSIRN